MLADLPRITQRLLGLSQHSRAIVEGLVLRFSQETETLHRWVCTQRPDKLTRPSLALCSGGWSRTEQNALPARLHGLFIGCLLDGVLLVPSPGRQVGHRGLGVCGSCFRGPSLHRNNLGST